MRNEFIRNLVLGALENKKISKLHKGTISFINPGILIIVFYNFRYFVIMFYIKISLVIIIIFIFSWNKKLEKRLNKKSSFFDKFSELSHLRGYLRKKTCKKTQSQVTDSNLSVPILASFF